MTPGVDLAGDQLIATRHLHAELALVWEAFTKPSHLAAFWGGHHATVPPDSVTVDLRVGGTFELETRSSDCRPNCGPSGPAAAWPGSSSASTQSCKT